MAVFEEQFQQHPVHEILAQLEAAIAQEFKHELDEAAIDNLERLVQSGAFIRTRLDGASPVLNSAARLNGVQKGLQNALNEVNQYTANGNSAHLVNASNHIDAPIATAATFPSLPGTPPAVTAEDAVSFKRLAERVVDGLKEKVAVAEDSQTRITAEATELGDSIEALQTQLESTSTRAQAHKHTQAHG